MQRTAVQEEGCGGQSWLFKYYAIPADDVYTVSVMMKQGMLHTVLKCLISPRHSRWAYRIKI